ncbi:protein cornichon [Musa troglodytarum]|uniref:Protein cornichon n=1 Tax=Musa troglodytarum TaxID=320322 RepID=A0A9E7G4R0_9LILI|nr:protein cornichon [Musa troglodytarum]
MAWELFLWLLAFAAAIALIGFSAYQLLVFLLSESMSSLTHNNFAGLSQLLFFYLWKMIIGLWSLGSFSICF